MNEIEQTLAQVKNFQFIHEHLLSSGQPTPEELQLMKDYGVTSVINLAPSTSANFLPHQDQLCLDIGLNYLHIPIGMDTPSAEQCLLVLDLIDHLVEQQVVWVHCDNNQQVSSLMYLYRQYYMQMDMATAHELLEQVWEPNATWTGLIHAIGVQLQGRRATQELQQSLISANHFA